MNLDFTEQDRAFESEVRTFLEEALPEDIRERTIKGLNPTPEQFRRWHRILYEKGWIAPNWPKEYGGCGWSPTQQYIFNREMGLAGAPRPLPFGLNMVGPVIYTFGTQDQKDTHLPPILSGDVFWCQGYSEPGAGSDLASLRMAAERDGDHYILNGTKLWTTGAHHADWIFCLVRTSKEEKPQEGISFILVDMKSEGISVDPIFTIDGFHHVNQVNFDNVKVPVGNRIGEEGKGWTYAKFLLAHERQAIADVGAKKRNLKRLKRLASDIRVNGGVLAEEPDFSAKLSDLEIRVMALEYTELRYLDKQSRRQEEGFEPSVLKVRGTELQQAIGELFVEALGYYALPYPDGFDDPGRNEPDIGPDGAAASVSDYLTGRAATIYGGSNEIQRNILAKLLLKA